MLVTCFFFSSRRRHTRLQGDWSSDVCSSDLLHHASDLLAEAHAARTLDATAHLFGRHQRAELFSQDDAFFFLIADRKSTRLNSSHLVISYAVFCLKKKKNIDA